MNNSALDYHKEIITRYSDMVHTLAFSQLKNRVDADDVFQEVFLQFIKSNKQFESEEHCKAWLIRVTINCCKKLWRSAWFRNTAPLEDNLESTLKQEKSEVYYAIMELPLKYRTVIHLFYREGMSVTEISKTLEKGESTITSQLTRARKLLRKILKEEYDFEEAR